MRVRVLFFGPVKDITGLSNDTLELPATATLQDVFNHYALRFPPLSALASSLLLARNREFSPLSSALADNDEIAFLPPVSGGAASPWTHHIQHPGGHFFALTRLPIDAAALARQILRPEDGAFVNFEGVVRNNSNGRSTLYLDYECYEDMAIKVMASLGSEIASLHPIGRIALVHRLGRLQIGESSVAVVVTAPHRKPAFDAALEGINRLKKTVPIWKKEYFADGESWVEGSWDDSLLSH